MLIPMAEEILCEASAIVREYQPRQEKRREGRDVRAVVVDRAEIGRLEGRSQPVCHGSRHIPINLEIMHRQGLERRAGAVLHFHNRAQVLG